MKIQLKLINTSIHLQTRCPVGCPSKVYELMIKCWEWEPNCRPSFKEIRECLESMFNNTNLNEEVERELGAENLVSDSYELDDQQCTEMTNSASSFKVFKSSLNGAPYKNAKQNAHGSLNDNSLVWNSMNINLNNSTGSGGGGGGLISTKSTVVPVKRNSTNKQSNKSGYVQQHQLVSKLKTAPIPPKRTSSFRDSSFQPDLESIRNSINLSNLNSNSSTGNRTNSTASSSTKQLEDEEILEAARETMNGLEKVFESLSNSVQNSTDNLMGSGLNEMNATSKGSIEDLKNVLNNKQKLPGQKLKPSKKALKLSKSSQKGLSKKGEQTSDNEKPNVFSNVLQDDANRSKVQVANLVEPESVKKAINRYGTLPKGASIGYLDSLQTCEINPNELGTVDYQDNQENNELNSDYPTIMQTNDSLLTSPDFIPVDFNRSMKQQINSNNHLATVSRKLAKSKGKKITKSVDDSSFNQQSTAFQLSSPEQRMNNSFKPTTFNNLTRQKSDLTHIRTNYDNSFDSINDLESDPNSRRTFIGGSSFFSSKNKSSKKRSSNDSSKLNSKNLNIDGTYLHSTSSSASSSNSNTINRDFSLGQNKENLDDASSISSFKPFNQPSGMPSPPAQFQSSSNAGLRRTVKKNLTNNEEPGTLSPPKQHTTSKAFKCSKALDDKNMFRKPELPSKFRSQSRNEDEEPFYVRSDQLDQLHSQLDSRLSLNSHQEQNNNTDQEDNLFYNQQPSDESHTQNTHSKSSFFESFKLKSRKKSADSLDSPQLPPRNDLNQQKKSSSSVKLGFGNRKVNKAGPQIPAPKIPLSARQNVFTNHSNNLIGSASSSMAEYVTPVTLKKSTDRNQQSNESSDENSNNMKKEKSFMFGLDKKSKTSQIKTRNNEMKLNRDDEKRQSISSITSLKKIWEPANKNHLQKSPDSLRSQKTLLADLANSRESPSFNNEFLLKSKSFMNNGKLRKDKNEQDNDLSDLSEQTKQYKKIIVQLSNVIERIFDEISINDHDQLKDLLLKIDQLRKNFQSFSDFGFIALQQRFKYHEFLKKFESQSEELNQYYDGNVNIKLVTWNKLCLALKLSLKELVSIVENQK